jgi:hypothetical protein
MAIACSQISFNVAKILLEQISRFNSSPADWLITLGAVPLWSLQVTMEECL